MARGGPRTPTNPAPVSGPGALSRRTDGGPGKQPLRTPTGLPYGEAGALTQLQRSAPMAASPGGNTPVPPGPVGGAEPPTNATPFGAPSQQPGTPVTAGAALGPGPGPEALGIPNPPSADLKALLVNLPVWEIMANQPGASTASRNLVRQLKGMTGG